MSELETEVAEAWEKRGLGAEWWAPSPRPGHPRAVEISLDGGVFVKLGGLDRLPIFVETDWGLRFVITESTPRRPAGR